MSADAKLFRHLAAHAPASPGRSHIYFFKIVGHGGAVKIGQTTGSVSHRLATIQKACPYEIRLAAVITDAFPQVEAHLHERFHAHRLRGEWFDGKAPGLADLIADVARGRELPIEIQRLFDAHVAHESRA